MSRDRLDDIVIILKEENLIGILDETFWKRAELVGLDKELLQALPKKTEIFGKLFKIVVV